MIYIPGFNIRYVSSHSLSYTLSTPNNQPYLSITLMLKSPCIWLSKKWDFSWEKKKKRGRNCLRTTKGRQTIAIALWLSLLSFCSIDSIQEQSRFTSISLNSWETLRCACPSSMGLYWKCCTVTLHHGKYGQCLEYHIAVTSDRGITGPVPGTWRQAHSKEMQSKHFKPCLWLLKH